MPVTPYFTTAALAGEYIHTVYTYMQVPMSFPHDHAIPRKRTAMFTSVQLSMDYRRQGSAVLMPKAATGTDTEPNYVRCKPYSPGPELSPNTIKTMHRF
jgi:hypothetical protein